MEKDKEKRLVRAIKRSASRVEERKQYPSKGYGLCDKCRSIFFRGYDFGKEFATCERMDRPLHLDKTSPVRVCTFYDERMKLDLSDMWMMATLIDVKKREIGFGLSSTEVEVIHTSDLDVEEHDFY